MKKKTIELYRRIVGEYRPQVGCFGSDDDRAMRMKRAVYFDLNPSERFVFILYAHFRSLRKLSDALDVPRTTIRDYVVEIQKKLKSKI